MIISAVTGARTQAPSTGAGPDFWWISMSILTRGRIFYQLLLRGSPSFQCHFLEKGYLDFDLDSDPCLFRYNFFYVKWKCVFQGFSVRLLSFRFVYNVFVYCRQINFHSQCQCWCQCWCQCQITRENEFWVVTGES